MSTSAKILIQRQERRRNRKENIDIASWVASGLGALYFGFHLLAWAVR